MEDIRGSYKNRLKEARKILGYNQTEMGAFLGMTMQNYQKYEYGIRELKSDLIKKICRAAKCTSDWLICNDSAIPDTLDKSERELVDSFRSINADGKKKVKEYTNDIKTHGRYSYAGVDLKTGESVDLTEEEFNAAISEDGETEQ